jgi:hypothetical protein
MRDTGAQRDEAERGTGQDFSCQFLHVLLPVW